MMAVKRGPAASVTIVGRFQTSGADASTFGQDGNGGMELGTSGGTNNTPFIDMHYNGAARAENYNVRLVNNGNGQFEIVDIAGNRIYFYAGAIGLGRAPTEKLSVLANAASNYAATFSNTGNNANRWGAAVYAGENTPTSAVSAVFVDFFEADGAATGSIYANAAGAMQYADVSDEREKEDVRPSDVDALKAINDLELVQYTRVKGDHRYAKTELGFTAQNVERCVPSAVSEFDRADGQRPIKMVSRTELIPYLCRAIQQLSSAIEEMRRRSRAGAPI